MPDTPHATGARAVFLSYAREDADAARRIADALRAFEIEVWFDQSELRGGDAWDQKIRKQIKECGLFMPVISATTQSRGEGYFRREWKMGVDRTHDMSSGVTFIVPVVIDDTPESSAEVPEEFMRYQWTRLPHGVPSAEFAQQVKRLVNKETGSRRTESRGKSSAMKAPTSDGERAPRRSWLIPTVVGLVVAGGVFLLMRKPEPVASSESKTENREPKTAAAPKPAAIVNDKSIAVLPFTNMSEDKDNAFFTDGVHEDVLTNLALVREFRVVSRTSVQPYRASNKSMKQIAQELGVTYILEGSVRRVGNKVRITGQLIHAATDEHVWAQTYDRDLTDIFAIQSELSQQIAGALKTALSPEEKVLISRRPTVNPAAYDLYLQSREVYNRDITAANRRKRIELLEMAVQLDPDFAQAWGELGSACAFAYFGNIEGAADYLKRAKPAIERAVQLAPDAPEVIDSLGTYLYYAFRDYEGATKQFERLAQLKPNSPVVYNSLGLIQRRQGNWKESLANSRRACELDPANLIYVRNLGATLGNVRRWDEAVALQRRIVAANPDDFREALNLARTQYEATGKRAVVDEFFARLPEDRRNDPEVIAERKYWASDVGDFAEAIRLDKLQPYYDGNGASHADQAVSAAGDLYWSGDKAGAVARLGDFPAELRRQLEKEPRNNRLLNRLSYSEFMQGHLAEARKYIERSVEIMPESRDALDGTRYAVNRAFFYDAVGDIELAVSEFTRLARVPCYFSIPRLRAEQNQLNPALRNDPRFQAMLNDPKNYEPLY